MFNPIQFLSLQESCPLFPVVRGQGMNWESLLRHLDCRREAVGQLEPPEPLYGVAPGGGRAGHGDGVDVEGGQGVAKDTVSSHAVQVEGGGAATGAVEAAYLRETG